MSLSCKCSACAVMGRDGCILVLQHRDLMTTMMAAMPTDRQTAQPDRQIHRQTDKYR